uniref:Uncharacterized protein n=1 Tax=Lygus hesperus TaxID=30085 RepID=A0A0A9WA52_LYGHE
MDPRKSLPLILLLGLTAVCFSKEVTEKQKNLLIKIVSNWYDAPPVEEFLEGDVKKEGNATTFTFKYLADDGKECNAEYTVTIEKKKPTHKKHKFECAMPAPSEDPDFD